MAFLRELTNVAQVHVPVAFEFAEEDFGLSAAVADERETTVEQSGATGGTGMDVSG